jgi:hypothetical protein
MNDDIMWDVDVQKSLVEFKVSAAVAPGLFTAGLLVF